MSSSSSPSNGGLPRSNRLIRRLVRIKDNLRDYELEQMSFENDSPRLRHLTPEHRRCRKEFVEEQIKELCGERKALIESLRGHSKVTVTTLEEFDMVGELFLPEEVVVYVQASGRVHDTSSDIYKITRHLSRGDVAPMGWDVVYGEEPSSSSSSSSSDDDDDE